MNSQNGTVSTCSEYSEQTLYDFFFTCQSFSHQNTVCHSLWPRFRVAGQIDIVNHLAINESQKLWSAVKHISRFRVAGHLVISEQLAGRQSYSHSVNFIKVKPLFLPLYKQICLFMCNFLKLLKF